MTRITLPPLSLTCADETCVFPSTRLDKGLTGVFNRGVNLSFATVRVTVSCGMQNTAREGVGALHHPAEYSLRGC